MQETTKKETKKKEATRKDVTKPHLKKYIQVEEIGKEPPLNTEGFWDKPKRSIVNVKKTDKYKK